MTIVPLAFGCKNNPKQQQSTNQSDTIIESTTLSNQIEQESGFNINELTKVIDSIYQIDIFTLDSIRIDTVKDFFEYYPGIETEDTDSANQIDLEFEPSKEKFLLHPLYAFSPQNAKYLFEYGTFSVLQFYNDSLAKSAFTKIFELFIIEEKGFKYTDEGLRLYYDVFSKGGCSYFYKNDFIIRKFRRCNDNYREHEKYENAILDFLYPQGFPENGGYFMRYCCSCPEQKRDEYR